MCSLWLRRGRAEAALRVGCWVVAEARRSLALLLHIRFGLGLGLELGEVLGEQKLQLEPC